MSAVRCGRERVGSGSDTTLARNRVGNEAEVVRSCTEEHEVPNQGGIKPVFATDA